MDSICREHAERSSDPNAGGVHQHKTIHDANGAIESPHYFMCPHFDSPVLGWILSSDPERRTAHISSKHFTTLTGR